MPNFLTAFRNAKNWLPRGSNKTVKRLYFAGFGVVTFIAPVLIIYGLWISDEAARDRVQIESLLRQRASSMALNVEMMIGQQLSIMEATAFFFSKSDMSESALAAEIRLADEAVQTVHNMMAVHPDGSPIDGSVLPFDVATTVRIVAKSGESMVQSRSIYIDNPTVDDAGIMLYTPMTIGDRKFVLVGSVPYVYVQKLIENYGHTDGVQAQNVIDNNYRLIARTSGISEFFGTEVSQRFRDLTKDNKPDGSFEAVSLDGADILSVFRYSPTLHWWFNVSIRKDYSESLVARSDNVLLISAFTGLILFISIGVIQALAMMERQVAQQQIEDEKAFSEATKKALDERVLLLREVYHRVKNNLQVLKSMIRLSTKDYPLEFRQKMDAVATRIDAIAEVHSMLYQSHNLSVLNFKDYVEKLIQLVDKVYTKPGQNVQVILNAQEILVSLEIAVPLGLSVVELLVNAYKHGVANVNPGVLSIHLHREKMEDGTECGVFEIEDNGSGLPADFRDRKSLGTRLVDRLVVQVNGSVEWPEPGHSNVRLRFALSNKVEEIAARNAGFVTDGHPVK